MTTFLDEFQAWCLKRGIRSRQGTRSGMSIESGKKRRSYLGQLLVEAGYLRRVQRGRFADWQVVPGRDWRRISIDEINNVLARLFPPGQLSMRQKGRHDAFAQAVRTFGLYGVDQGLWDQEKLVLLRAETAMLSRNAEYDEVQINRPELAHAFERWLRTRTEPISYSTDSDTREAFASVETIQNDAIVMFLGQWLAMRYEEAIDVRADLRIVEGGSLELDWRSSTAKILGKGHRGKTRVGIPALPEVRTRIEEFLALRERALGQESETFPWLLWIRRSIWGERKPEKYSSNAGGSIMRFRGYARAFNEEMKAAGRIDQILDLELCTTHKLGRHVFGTWFGPRVDPKILKRAMGITMDVVAERYRNYGDTSVREMFLAAAEDSSSSKANPKTTKVATTRTSKESASSSSGEIVCRKCDVSFSEYELWARHQKEFHGGGA